MERERRNPSIEKSLLDDSIWYHASEVLRRSDRGSVEFTTIPAIHSALSLITPAAAFWSMSFSSCDRHSAIPRRMISESAKTFACLLDSGERDRERLRRLSSSFVS